MTVLRNISRLDARTGALSASDIVIEDQRIAAILPANSYEGEDYAVVDCSRRLAIPGLINAHTHSHAVPMRGMADRWCLEMSLAFAPWVLETQSLELIYWSTYVGAAEMALNGVTSCLDLVLLKTPLAPQKMAAVAQAYTDVGIRALLAPMVSDIPLYSALEGFNDFLPAALRDEAASVFAPSANDTLSPCSRIFESWSFPRDRVKPGIAPTILNHCSDGFLAGCKRLSTEFDLPIHMHVAESELQAINARRAYGRSVVRRLADIGYLNERFTAAHCVWVDRDDLVMFSDAGANIVHVPVSNLRLGAGIAPIHTARNIGVNVALATDGCNSADRLSVFDVMKQAAMVSRVGHQSNPDQWLSSADALDMATAGGARVLGFDGLTGRLETGAQADLTILSLDSFTFTPLNEPLTQMINAETGENVSDVIVAGKRIVANGKLQGSDPIYGREKLGALTAECFRKDSPHFSTAEKMIPYLIDFYRESRRIGLDR